MRRRLWLQGPKGSLCTPRDRGGGMGSLSRRDAVAKLPIWGLTCGYFRDLWTEKSKLASMLVVWSPRGARVPMAWGGCVGAAGYPMGCQIGRLTRHETPLARPSQATKISKPNRFAYPFRSRPRGVRGAPILNLRPHQAPSYRDTSTANLGLGVTPGTGVGRRQSTKCQHWHRLNAGALKPRKGVCGKIRKIQTQEFAVCMFAKCPWGSVRTLAEEIRPFVYISFISSRYKQDVPCEINDQHLA